jgi:hypothetical protein
VFDEAYVKQLRTEAAEWRTKAQTAETDKAAALAQVATFENEKLSDKERLEKERDEARALAAGATTANMDLALKYDVAILSQKLGVVDSSTALAVLLAEKKGEIVWENGVPTNTEALLSTLLETRPFLKGTPAVVQTPSTIQTNPSGNSQQGTLTIEDVKKMSPQEVNRRWDEVAPVLSAQR